MVRRSLFIANLIVLCTLVGVTLMSYLAPLEHFISTDRVCIRVRTLTGKLVVNVDGGPDAMPSWQTSFRILGIRFEPRGAPYSQWRYIDAELPLWMPITVASVAPTWLVWARARQRRIRGRRGRCLQCGYDLTGNISGICPECGAKVEPEPLRPATVSDEPRPCSLVRWVSASFLGICAFVVAAAIVATWQTTATQEVYSGASRTVLISASHGSVAIIDLRANRAIPLGTWAERTSVRWNQSVWGHGWLNARFVVERGSYPTPSQPRFASTVVAAPLWAPFAVFAAIPCCVVAQALARRKRRGSRTTPRADGSPVTRT